MLRAGFHGVVSRHKKRYGQVKIKPTESKEKMSLMLTSLSLTIQWQLDCRSRKLSESLRTGIVIGLFFCFCLRLRQSSFHWIISVGFIRGIGTPKTLLSPFPTSPPDKTGEGPYLEVHYRDIGKGRKSSETDLARHKLTWGVSNLCLYRCKLSCTLSLNEPDFVILSS